MNFISVRETFIFNSSIYFKPLKRFENRRCVRKFTSFDDSTYILSSDYLEDFIYS